MKRMKDLKMTRLTRSQQNNAFTFSVLSSLSSPAALPQKPVPSDAAARRSRAAARSRVIRST
jgi:hypothetical protein